MQRLQEKKKLLVRKMNQVVKQQLGSKWLGEKRDLEGKVEHGESAYWNSAKRPWPNTLMVSV